MSLLRNLLLKNGQIARIINVGGTPTALASKLSLPQFPRGLSVHHPAYSTPSQINKLQPSLQTLLITEACKKRLKDILDQGTFLRISVEGGGCSGFQYKFEISKDIEEDDVVLSADATEEAPLLVAIDKTSLDILRGSTLDYETELIRSAFRIINNPKAEQGCSCGSSFNVKID